MAYETVVRLPKELIRGTEEARFLGKNDLMKLKEHELLFS